MDNGRERRTTPRGHERTPRYLSPAARLLTLALAIAIGGPAASAQERDPSREPPPDLSTLDLEQLLQVEIVYAASKREQKLREAPSAVSVVTADEIKHHGYRTLADVLRSLPSFYVTYDRNYSYVGVRGFARPGDYSARVLLLVNGLRTNDNIYDQAYVGEEFLVDVDMIERVEVIRGPSAAIYGSSAFFAVINVVTKRAGDMPVAEMAATATSLGGYGGRISYARNRDNGVSLLLSASYAEAEGAERLYFREFDDPSTNNGVVQNADDEHHRRFLASISKGAFSLQTSHVSRNKRVPTGSYATLFNDGRFRTTDELTLTSLGYARSSGEGSSVDARLHAGQYRYHAAYPYEPSLPANQDGAWGEWWGADVDVTRSLFRHHLVTAGFEYRDNYRQDQRNFDPEPYAVWVDEQQSSRRAAAFVQDELRLFRALILYGGVRFDWYQTFGSAISPRIGAIYLPNDATTLKVLFGRAFRAPSEYEFHYASELYKTDPSLHPEEIETVEVVAERLLGRTVRVSAAGFRNRITDLIALTQDPTDDLLVFRNAEAIDSDGLELGLDANRGGGISGRASYSVQRTRDHDTGLILTNSPRQMAKLQLSAVLPGTSISAGLGTYMMSSRRTLAGERASGHGVTNLTVIAPRVLGRLAVTTSIYNLFDARYGDPGSEEHAQDIIEQDGRTFRVKASIQF